MKYSTATARLARAARPIVEMLESRRLLSTTTGTDTTITTTGIVPLNSTTLAHPSVLSSSPASSATKVSLDASITCDLNLPNAGLDPSTLNSNTVTLVRTSDQSAVSIVVNTSGGGDSIVCDPLTNLQANTNYTFTVTSGVADLDGATMTPFSMSFTTGTAVSPADPSIGFQQVALPTATGVAFTCVRFGPDGKLYASSEDGRIFRYTILADGTLSQPQIITSLQTANGGQRLITGFAFDPHATAANPIIWVSNSPYQFSNVPDFTGKITVMSGSDLQIVQDAVINLPRSNQDHSTEQPVFGPDGALYFCQGSDAAMGAPDSTWGFRSEHELTAAILRLDVSKITPGQPINVLTPDVGGTYNPYAPGAPLTIYATGVRNAFDIIFTANGTLYAPSNGSSAGGNTPAFPNSVNGTRIDTGALYSGPNVPGLTNVSTAQDDYLYQVVQGGYYGHPDPARGEFVLDGGNPTSGLDPAEISQYPVGTMPDSNFRGYAYDLGAHASPDGIIEYQDHAFGGKLQGALLITDYSAGSDIVALIRDANGNIIGAERGITGLTGLNNPVNLVEDPNTGNIYVAEHGGQRLVLLRPITPNPVASLTKTVMVFNDVASSFTGGSGSSAAQTLTITNTGNVPLTLGAGAFSILNDPSVTTLDAASFVITNLASLPASLAPGSSVNLSITFTASYQGMASALLHIASNDPNHPLLTVQLHGIGTTGLGGASEPSLARILRAYDIPTIVGDGPNDVNMDASTFYPATPDPSSQELPMSRIVKAGDGPVTIQLLASFNASNQPLVRFGYYSSGDSTNKTELFTLNSADAQTTNPNPLGATTFDPGSTEFSLYTIFPHFTDNGQPRVSYSEDAFNTWDANVPRKIRFFPLENPDGSIVPNAYVFAVEDNNIPFGNIQPYDSNDVVGIIRNVKAAADATGPALGLQNMDGAPFNNRLIFNHIEEQNPTYGDATHNTATLRLTNSGSSTLTITGITLSNPVWYVTNLPRMPMQIAPGGSYDLQLKFQTGVGPTHSDNQTNDTQTENGWAPNKAGGVYTGTLTITSDDASRPTRTVQLAGYWQMQTENENEPGLQTIVNLLAGYQTVISNTQQPNFPEGATTPTYYGEEVVSPYWNIADPSQPISVLQLDGFHNEADLTQTPPVLTEPVVDWYVQGSSTHTKLFTDATDHGQTLFPQALNSTSTASATFNPGSSTFGWLLDGNYSDDTKNTVGGGGGHHVRFYPVRDQSGNLIPNTWLACLDYGSTTFENYDFQDIVLLITNMRPSAQPAAPTDGQASATSAGTLLQWAPSSGTVTGYNVYRGTSPTNASTFVKLNSTALTSTSYLDTTAPAGVTSYYRITAVNGSAESQGTGAMAAAVPAAPTTLAATAIAAGQVQLTWTASAGNVTYRVEREAVGASGFVEIASGVTGSKFTDNTTQGSTTYVYQIRAENGSGLSPYSSSATATTPVAVPPSAPANLAAGTVTGSQITLNWAAATGTVTAYHIERQGPGDAGFVEIAGNVSSTTYTDKSVQPGAVYSYRVRAENTGAMSGYSNVLNVTTPPSAPTGLTVTQSSGGLLLSWQASTGTVTDYHIERKGPSDASFVEIAANVTNTTFYDMSGAPLTAYVYRVRAENAGGFSSYVTSASVTTPAAPGQSTATAWNWGMLAQGSRHDTKTLTTGLPKQYYTFTVDRTTKITLKLTGIKDNVRMDVWTPANVGVAGAAAGKKKSLTLTFTVNAGTYFVKPELLGTIGTKYTISIAGKYVKVKTHK